MHPLQHRRLQRRASPISHGFETSHGDADASSGQIGRSTALALHRAGWSVCITARRAEALEETLRLMRAQPGSADGSAQALKATSFAGDITSEETVLA